MPFVEAVNICAAFKFRRLVTTLVFVTALPGLLRSFQTQTNTVVVHHVAGSPIPGAKARLLSLDRVLEVKANADGELVFNGVAPGTYKLEVTVRGFRGRVYPDVRIPIREPMDIVLTPEIPCGIGNAVDYEAVRPEASRLSGYAIDEDTGKGISGIKIELMDATSHSKVGETVSGRNGDFAFHDLPPGRYRVQASKYAYEPTEISEFLVPRENVTILHLHLDRQGHMHICQ
jgi:hypothetical protein